MISRGRDSGAVNMRQAVGQNCIDIRGKRDKEEVKERERMKNGNAKQSLVGLFERVSTSG